MSVDQAARRVSLALSILNNAEALGHEQALREAIAALDGASITEILAMRGGVR